MKFQCTGVILDNNCYILEISCTCCISLSHELDNQIRGIIAKNVCLFGHWNFLLLISTSASAPTGRGLKKKPFCFLSFRGITTTTTTIIPYTVIPSNHAIFCDCYCAMNIFTVANLILHYVDMLNVMNTFNIDKWSNGSSLLIRHN